MGGGSGLNQARVFVGAQHDHSARPAEDAVLLVGEHHAHAGLQHAFGLVFIDGPEGSGVGFRFDGLVPAVGAFGVGLVLRIRLPWLAFHARQAVLGMQVDERGVDVQPFHIVGVGVFGEFHFVAHGDDAAVFHQQGGVLNLGGGVHLDRGVGEGGIRGVFVHGAVHRKGGGLCGGQTDGSHKEHG